MKLWCSNDVMLFNAIQLPYNLMQTNSSIQTLVYLVYLCCHEVAVPIFIVKHGREEMNSCKDTVCLIEQGKDKHDQCELESWRRVIID